MNTSTHAVWKTSSADKSSSSSSLPGVIATISKEFGYKRQWSFRSSTGFTALGVGRYDDEDAAANNNNESCRTSNRSNSSSRSQLGGSDINGVIFQVPTEDIPDFDRREVGYTKIRVPLEYITIYNHSPSNRNNNTEDVASTTPPSTSSSTYHEQANFTFTPNDNIWLYVPLPGHTHYADENHPLLQSYVDTVLQGCLEWGGQSMAEQFILSTGGWSEYFLNDTPSSRRPWLYRKEYNTIDELLQKYEELTYYAERRHPEEFASAFNQRMRGKDTVSH